MLLRTRLGCALGTSALLSGGATLLALGLIIALPLLMVEADFRWTRARRAKTA